MRRPSQTPSARPSYAVDEHPAQLLDPGRHGSGVTVQRRLGREGGGEDLGVHRCDLPGVERVTESSSELGRPGEGPFQGDLLVQDHPDQQGEWILGQEFVGFRVAGEMERRSYREL